MKLDYRKTFLLGLGFFAISLSWSVYNSFVPVFLKKFTDSALLIGFIMTFDNLAAIIIQPFFGVLSDHTWTRFGRRMPYLLLGVPLSAVFFFLIPWHFSLPSLILIVVLFNTAMTVYRAPTVALMPDFTPSPLRSKANGVINFMGGLGALLAFFVGSKLYDLDKRAPFAFTALMMLIAITLLYRGVKERREERTEAVKEKIGLRKASANIIGTKSWSVLAILGAIFFWFLGYNAIESFFTLYGKLFLGIKESTAAFSLGFLSVAFLAMAIPAGFIGTRLGRRRTIITGIMIIMVVLVGLHYLPGFTARYPGVPAVPAMQILLLVVGFGWALININSYPMVVDMTTDDLIGTFTGLYYFFSSTAAVGGPWLMGWIIDLINSHAQSETLGYGSIFAFAVVTFGLALLCMLLVRHGEIKEEQTVQNETGG